MPDTPKRETVGIIVVAIVFLIAIPIAFLILPKKGDVIRYDCSIAEISPDYPIEVREQCRKLRAENIKEDLRKPK
jgi:hypothetical protein